MAKPLRPLLTVVFLGAYLGSHMLHVAAKEPAPGDKKAPKHQRKQGAAPTAASLVKDMQKSVAFIAMSAKDKISVKSKEARPFWSALKSSSKGLDLMEKGLKGDHASTLKGQDELGRSMTQLCTSWGVLRGSHPKLQVGRGVIALSESYRTYLYHFGPTVARYKKGGDVTAQEKAAVASCLELLAKLAEQFDALGGKAKAKSYQARLVHDLESLIAELQEVKVTNLKSYCKFMYQWDRLTYAIGGYTEIVEVWYPEFYTEWKVVNTEYTTMTTEFASLTETYYESWEYTELSVKSYDDYYERTAAVATVTEEQESEYESYAEEYSEEEATEESSEESEEIDEEVEIDEDDDETAFEEVEDSEDDEDGDGESDEEDTDDDNDGTPDDEDTDDDGDGVDDGDDEDEEEDDAGDEDEGDDEDEDSDDDGIDDDDDGGDEE